MTSINSQIYMTKPKQAKKELSENTGTTFSAIMPPFTSRGGGIIAEMTVHCKDKEGYQQDFMKRGAIEVA